MRSGAKSHETSAPAAFFFRSRFFPAWTAKSGKRVRCHKMRVYNFWTSFGEVWAPKSVSDAVVFGSRFRTSIFAVSGWLLGLIWELAAPCSAHVAGKGAKSKK